MMKNNYGDWIEKYLCAIAWHKDVTENLQLKKHILTMTNGLIKHPLALTYSQKEKLNINKEELEMEIEIITNDLAKDIFTQSILN